jgi:leucyl aminopeptidase
MKTNLSFSAPAEVETDCLVAVVLDRGEKDKTDAYLAIEDKSVQQAAADVLGTEATGKMLETTLLHKPANLKAKRLLLIGGGKAKKFSSLELRKLAGAAVRGLKSRSLRSFAMITPDGPNAGDAVTAIVEGAFVGNFDSNTYQSDRKDQQIDNLTIIARGDQKNLQNELEEARIIGESQNFVRQLVNEPSNRMTPTILADHAKKMSQEVGLKCEVYGADKIKELKMGAFWGVAQGSDEPPALIVMRYEPAGAPEKPVLGLVVK